MSFFKAYDMRGTFGTDFDSETVRRVGLALPRVLSACNARHELSSATTAPRILIGRDCRLSGGEVRDALVEGLVAGGARVVDIGLVTTPMVYFFTATEGYDGSVMITASHNPPSDNGLKVSMKGALPVGYAEGLGEIERLVKNGVPTAAPVRGNVSVVPSAETVARYVAWLNRRASFDFSNLRVAIDCSDGMSSLIARAIFSKAVTINDTPNGAFPAHSPNPLVAESREQLSSLVRNGQFDCGVIFDGDADRAMFVDERGDFVQPDFLIPVVARACRRNGVSGIAERKRVLHDVRTSRGAIETLLEDGFEPVMVPVGHAFAKPKMRECSALCGGELAGHYYFGDFFGCDSGAMAALRVLGELSLAKREGKTFSQLVAPIVSRYANSGELNFRVDDKDAAIARVLAVAAERLPAELSRSDIDGLRLEFCCGWVNIRKSNTEPYLRLLAECDTRRRLDEWLAILKGAIVGGSAGGAKAGAQR